MRLNNTMLGDNIIKVYYSSQAITKPQAKSNEAALKEIENTLALDSLFPLISVGR